MKPEENPCHAECSRRSASCHGNCPDYARYVKWREHLRGARLDYSLGYRKNNKQRKGK